MGRTLPQKKGIYVEISIAAELSRVWQLTQIPELHEQWDLRFSEIRYLPKASADDAQQFTYQTRIGFGLSIEGTGTSVGEQSLESGESTSSLQFASDDFKSLIREGSGYWRYVPRPQAVRFLTWYDYRVRFGLAGRLIDRAVFRPLMGWATAWSFDRLRLWAEGTMNPGVSRDLFLLQVLARVSVPFVWIWHGLIPKLLFRDADEQLLLAQSGLPGDLMPWIGWAEVLFGVAILYFWRNRSLLLASGVGMLVALGAVATSSSHYLTKAFNPVTLNSCVLILSTVAWVLTPHVPSARRCLRAAPESNHE